MRTLTTALCLFLLPAAAVQARPSTFAMACDRAASIVAVNGAVVLNTSPTTYDRFVTDAGYCMVGEYTDPAFVPSADDPACFVGYRCRERFKFR